MVHEPTGLFILLAVGVVAVWLAWCFGQWPFHKRTPKSREPTYHERMEEWEKKLQVQFHIGDEFWYIGRRMRVSRVGYWEVWPGIGSKFNADVWCDYGDDQGRLYTWKFEPHEHALLLKNRIKPCVP